jgi:hypothetical protein
MKKLTYILGAVMAAATLFGCQDVIDLKTETGQIQLVVDGWLTNETGNQTIKLSRSAAYFDNSAAKPALGATVVVTDDKGTIYSFKDLKNNGNYVWTPSSPQETLGRLSGQYKLNIKVDGEEYVSASVINRVPKIDSIAYEYRKPSVTPTNAPKEGYLAEFYAKDFQGPGDCYWIRYAKNSKEWNRASDLEMAYDAAFSPGAPTDGFMFILPLRQSITANNRTELYAEKDTIKVQLYSITEEAFFFLNQIRNESNNQGLFATPPNNLPTNIINVKADGKKALGFFGTSAVSRLQVIVDPKKARPSTKP